MTLTELRKELRELASAEIAAHSSRFFKTGPGEYGEGDVFMGVRVPKLRKLVGRCPTLPLQSVARLLASRIHEERLLALLLLVDWYNRGEAKTRNAIYRTYLENTRHINNWDLVDSSAHLIVGAHLQDRSRRPLYKLAKSKQLWERRISIMATYWFIKRGDYADTLQLADALLDDEHDLIHKAVGWMLREVGNRARPVEEDFLATRYRRMPRTMLRYAIEKFPQPNRKAYLRGER